MTELSSDCAVAAGFAGGGGRYAFTLPRGLWRLTVRSDGAPPLAGVPGASVVQGCIADIADTDGQPIPDGVVDNGDFNVFFGGFFAYSTECGVQPPSPEPEPSPLGCLRPILIDIATTDGDLFPDGVVDNGDFSVFFSAFFECSGL